MSNTRPLPNSLCAQVLSVLRQLPSPRVRARALEITEPYRRSDDSMSDAEYEQMLARVTRALQEKEPPQ